MCKTPRPGDIGFSRVNGKVGLLIGFLQWAQGGGSKYGHCFIYLDNNEILEAKPKGARIVPLDPAKKAIFFDWNLTDEQRNLVVAEARKFVGAKYSFLDYIALAFSKYNKYPVKLFNKLAISNKYICSTLVDVIYNNCGIKIFEDGRNSYSVSPGDILFRYLERDWVEG